jgi:hypothetical protein
MNKKDQKRVIRAIEGILSNEWIWSCQALANDISYTKEPLVDRYAEFFQEFNHYWDWRLYEERPFDDSPYYSETAKLRRALALTLFMIAEQDVL